MKKMLVVDDREENRYLLQVLLSHHGYQVETAHDGAEALMLAHRSPPDLLITDILMPGMDGFELCRQWKRDDQLKSIPLVFYTATYTDPADEQFALELGADAFIVKPAEPDDFMQRIRTVLEIPAVVQPLHPRTPQLDEPVLFKQYNQVLVHKLEQKLQQLEAAEDYLNALFKHIPDGILVTDAQGLCVDANDSLCRMLDTPHDALVGLNAAEMLILPEIETLQTTLNTTYNHHAWPLRRRDGSTLDTEVAVSTLPDGRVLAVIRDISERIRAEQELRIAAIAFESQEGMMVTDPNGTILKVNAAFTTITGYTANEVQGKNPRLLQSGRQHGEFYQEMWDSLKQTGNWQGEIWNRRKNGEIYPEHLAISAVRNRDGMVTNYVGTLADVTMSHAASEEIQRLAFYDALTGLPNRRLLQDRLKQAFAFSMRSGKHGALLFIDLDNFKSLNDTLGHDTGDLLLQQIAQRLTACVRENDSVARFGGDEFVVMLEELDAHELEAASLAESIANKILANLRQPFHLGSHVYHSSCSIGATLFNQHKLSIDDLLKQADIALYQAKSLGKNALCFFDTAMQDNISSRVALENELRNALEKNQFHLHYQLQVDENGRAVGAEALIRWQHPDFNLVALEDFIPLAEDTGMILAIGLWVIDTACAQLARWQQQEAMRELTLSVNVSARQMRQASFVEDIEKILDKHTLNNSRLKLELTESLLLNNVEDTIAKMLALQQLGLRFALDDFGIGYSSLQYLKRLPLDELKIDQSFVRDIASDTSDLAIVRTIIAMAHTLNLNVIAEGVESEAQRQLLAQEGCRYYQGYLFGKPLAIEEFEQAVSARSSRR